MQRTQLTDLAYRWLGPASLSLGILGFVAGALIILEDKAGSPASQDFSKTIQFYMWVFLIAGQTALWAVLAPPLAVSVLWRKQRLAVWLKLLLLLAALAALHLSEVFSVPAPVPLMGFKGKMLIINAAGAVAPLLAILGIWQTQAALERLHARVAESGSAFEPAGAAAAGARPERPAAIAAFLRLREEMERYLLAAGVIIGAATLATGGLRNALLASNPNANFPRETVLGYGLLFSVLLALVYAPAYVWLARVRALLREKLAPLPDAAPTSWADWNSERRAVDELLQVPSGVTSFGGAVSILTPLLGSLLPVLFGAAGR